MRSRLRAAADRDRDRTMPRPLLAAALLLFATAAPALASSSAWYDADGGSIRLLTSGAPAERGVVQGALQIDLKPGWKPYWLDPGDAGVPPSLDASASRNIASA